MKLKSFECPDTGLIYEFSKLAEAYVAENENREIFVMSEAEVQEMLDEGAIAFNEDDVLEEGGYKKGMKKEDDDVDGDEDDDKEGTSDEDSVDESEEEDEETMDESDDEESDEESMDESDDEDEEMEESLELDYDVNLSEEDKNALFSNGLISEEYAETAQTIFETAIKEKVEANTKTIKEHFEGLVESKVEAVKEQLTEDVNSYLEYVISEWMTDNEIAIESSLKVEMNEEFITKLSEAFEGHFIKIPDERYDILEGLANKIETLEEELNGQLEVNTRQLKENKELKLEAEIKALSEDLSTNQAEKFKSLVENVSYDDLEEFKTKATQLKESYFKSSGAGPALINSDDEVTPVGDSYTIPDYIAKASQI